jgi:hypothetical protein
MSREKKARLNVIIPLELRIAYKKHCIDKGVSIQQDINNYIQKEVSKPVGKAA